MQILMLTFSLIPRSSLIACLSWRTLNEEGTWIVLKDLLSGLALDDEVLINSF